MTIKVIDRETRPATWHIGKRIAIAGEVLELVEINGQNYTWIDVCRMDECSSLELEGYVP